MPAEHDPSKNLAVPDGRNDPSRMDDFQIIAERQRVMATLAALTDQYRALNQEMRTRWSQQSLTRCRRTQPLQPPSANRTFPRSLGSFLASRSLLGAITPKILRNNPRAPDRWAARST
jgi:hypothetical protein